MNRIFKSIVFSALVIAQGIGFVVPAQANGAIPLKDAAAKVAQLMFVPVQEAVNLLTPYVVEKGTVPFNAVVGVLANFGEMDVVSATLEIAKVNARYPVGESLEIAKNGVKALAGGVTTYVKDEFLPETFGWMYRTSTRYVANLLHDFCQVGKYFFVSPEVKTLRQTVACLAVAGAIAGSFYAYGAAKGGKTKVIKKKYIV